MYGYLFCQGNYKTLKILYFKTTNIQIQIGITFEFGFVLNLFCTEN